MNISLNDHARVLQATARTNNRAETPTVKMVNYVNFVNFVTVLDRPSGSWMSRESEPLPSRAVSLLANCRETLAWEG
jgi:hypothetical protein